MALIAKKLQKSVDFLQIVCYTKFIIERTTMSNSFMKIAKMIREDYRTGFCEFDDNFASSAFCFSYGGENGKWNSFCNLYPEEAKMLETMVVNSKNTVEEDYED